jgi:hypothetical protein
MKEAKLATANKKKGIKMSHETHNNYAGKSRSIQFRH